MLTIHPQYKTDLNGEKVVVLPAQEFENLMEMLDEMDDIRLYDEAKAENAASVSLDEAFRLIEEKR